MRIAVTGIASMVFLEHFDEVLPQVLGWTRETLKSRRAAPVGAGA